ncbi:MAG TPA: hypothetical protein VJ570_07415 [Holophagaceae bacterium]|nr:hypothetical protein [Holophagaceae bacterium]
MRPLLASLFSALLALGLVGCGASAYDGGGGDVTVTLQGQFEKPNLTPAGFSGSSTLPARYCYMELRDATSDVVLAKGYLDGNGQGATTLPAGTQAYAVLYASYEVPLVPAGSGFFMRGSVVDAPPPAPGLSGDQQLAYFNGTQDWFVTSANTSFTSSGTLTVKALASNHIAGAFAIADQAVTFAQGVQALSPPLTLPNLHTYWSTSTNPADQLRSYPRILQKSDQSIPITASNRALFTHAVYGDFSGAANSESDAFDDAVLQETFAHLLFADYSYHADGSSALSLLRRDNDNSYTSRFADSEASIAFVDGYCDFLAGALRNQAALLDSYVDGGGVARVDDFDLSLPLLGSEFVRGSVATNLWSIWKGPLGGGQSGLQALWDRLNTSNAGLDGVGDYNGAPLGCYPTYLVGLRNAVTLATWTSIQGTFAASGIADPGTAYFSGSTLWSNQLTIPFTATGTLAFFGPGSYRYYDRTQAQAYRFVQGSAVTRTLTLTPDPGVDFELDLIGPGGLIAASYASPYGTTRTLTLTAPGTYVVRVRVNPDSAEAYTAGNYGYSLTLN